MSRTRTFPLNLLPPFLVGKKRVSEDRETARRPPRNLIAPVVSGTPTVGETLTATLGSWSGELPLSFVTQWRRDGVAIDGETSLSYTLQAADEGALVDILVTATNSLGESSSDSNDLGPIAAAGVAPTITVAPELTWTVAHGSSPTITEGTYTGDAGTWTYDLVRLPSTTVLSGVSKATVEAYVSDRVTDVGPSWKVAGTITNGAGSDSADSNAVAYDPSSIASYYADYDADLGVEEASGDPAEDGDSVEFWRDQAGSSLDASQATAGNRPTLRVGTGPSGHNLVEFHQSGTAKWLDAAGVSLASAHTSFVVARFDVAGTTALLYDGITSRRAVYKSGASWLLFAGSGVANTGLPPAGWFIDEAEFNGASSSHRVNAGTPATGNPGANVLTGLRLGNANGSPTISIGFDGDIARAIFFDAVLSADDKADVRAYIAHHYGVTV